MKPIKQVQVGRCNSKTKVIQHANQGSNAWGATFFGFQISGALQYFVLRALKCQLGPDGIMQNIKYRKVQNLTEYDNAKHQKNVANEIIVNKLKRCKKS